MSERQLAIPEKKKKQLVKAATPQKQTNLPKTVAAKQQPQPKSELMYVKVPDCVKHYYLAATNPCDTSPGACLPCDLFPLPSQKLVGFARGTFKTGTTGYGFISFTPALSNDASAIGMTSATSVMAVGTVFSAVTNLVAASLTNLPYANASFASNVITGRNVAYGMRVRCLDSMMNRGGQCVFGESPDHSDLAGLTFQSLDNSPYSRTTRITSGSDPSGWDAAVSSSGPCLTSELSYSAVGTGPLNGNNPLLIAVSSPAAGALYEYEAYIHNEYMGRNVPSKTPSHTDPTTFAKVTEVLKEHTAVSPLTPNDTVPLWKQILSGIGEALPRIIAGGTAAYKFISGDFIGGSLALGATLGMDSLSSAAIQPTRAKQLLSSGPSR